MNKRLVNGIEFSEGQSVILGSFATLRASGISNEVHLRYANQIAKIMRFEYSEVFLVFSDGKRLPFHNKRFGVSILPFEVKKTRKVQKQKLC